MVKDMKRKLLIAAIIVLPMAFFLLVTTSQAGMGKVTIVKPEDGEVVQGTSYTVEFELEKIARGDHVHLFLDGEHVGPVMKKSKYKLTNLKKGNHTVMLKLADKNHAYLGPQAETSFVVE
jgi:hypothetical protein